MVFSFLPIFQYKDLLFIKVPLINLIIDFIPALEEITSSFYHVNLIQQTSQQLYKSGKFEINKSFTHTIYL